MSTFSHAQGIHAFTAHRFFLRSALAGTSSFAWIFLLQFFYHQYGTLTNAFAHTIGLYALVQIVIIVLSPYAASRLASGMRERMLLGVASAILAFSILAASLLQSTSMTIVGTLSFAVFFGVYRALYFAPYALTKFSNTSSESISQEIGIAMMPAISGIVLVGGVLSAGSVLFAGATILMASLIPLFSVPDIFERYVWSYSETFAELFDPRNARVVEFSFIEGVQGTALLLIWPLSIFIIAGFSYTSVGLILTATLLITILMRSYRAQYLQRRLPLRVFFSVTSWLFRIVAATPVSVILIDVYSSVGEKPLLYTTLEQSADNGTYVDEYSVLKELALAIGRLSMCLLTISLITIFSLPVGLAVTFVIAGALAGLSTYLAHRIESLSQ